MKDRIREKIRDEQNEALDVIEKYWLDKKEKKYALIKMPTGTGKTGIIASIPYILNDCNNILILVPNNQLPKQIFEEITKNFWTKINLNDLELKYQYKLLKGIKSKLNNEHKNIYISTIQAMMSIKRELYSLFSELQQQIDLIIFDEGHRQPSKKWKDIIIDLNKKTILFTATPYRNDKIKFNITDNEDYIYNLSYQDSINKGYIKDVEFLEYQDMNVDDKGITDFINFIYKIYKKEGKLIIRSNQSDVIEKIVRGINSKVKKMVAVGIHSNFNNEIYKRKNYTKELNNEFQIFVHQNKLIEGIDMKCVNTLVIHKSFENSRSIVQQIGRILRKDFIDDNHKAKVYVSKSKIRDYISQWNNFKRYDSEKNKDMYYINQKFREKFQFDDEFYKYLRFSKATNIYYSKKINFEEIKKVIIENLLLNNVVKYAEKAIGNLWVICYELESCSNILVDKVYMESSIQYSVIAVKNEMIFFYDSHGFSLHVDELSFEVELIENNKVLSLFGRDSNFKYVKTDRLNIQGYGKNAQIMLGIGLEKVSQSATENLVACTSAKAEINSNIKRYVGITTSRVNDNDKCDIKEYMGWIDGIYHAMEIEYKNDYFKRFARVESNLGDANATSILIDIADDENICLNNGIQTKTVKMSQMIYPIDNNEFYMDIDDKEILCKLIIEKKKKSIKIRVKLESNIYYIQNQRLDEYINSDRFKVLFNNNLFYINGYLYVPNINYFGIDLDDTNIGRRMYGLNEMDGLIDEKKGEFSGQEKDYSFWDKKSVFGVLVSYLDKEKEFDYYVCDDLNTEMADFIAINEKSNKIALIHCKYSDSQLSASTFHEVTGQVLKNLEYLSAVDVETNNKYIDKHIESWNHNWGNSKIKRIIPNTMNGKQFWDKYKRILINPYNQLEVWIFGNLISKKKLSKSLKGDNPTEETKQIMWILNTTDEAVANIGATLKIFCKE